MVALYPTKLGENTLPRKPSNTSNMPINQIQQLKIKTQWQVLAEHLFGIISTLPHLQSNYMYEPKPKTRNNILSKKIKIFYFLKLLKISSLPVRYINIDHQLNQ